MTCPSSSLEKHPWSDLERYGANFEKPVLFDLEGGDWDLSDWSPAALEARLGDEEAPVAISDEPVFGYSADASGTEPSHLFRFETLPFAAALSEMLDPRPGRHLYLMQVLVPPFLPSLAEIAPSLSFMDARLNKRSIWIGPEGTTTPLHFDRFRSLFIQLHGSKKINLFPPDDVRKLEMFPVESTTPHLTKVNLDSLAPQEAAALNSRASAEIELRPGEALLVPPYWFHQVRNRGLSISVHQWWACKMQRELPANAGALVLHEFRRCRLQRLAWAACNEERPLLLDLAPLFVSREEPGNALLVVAAALEMTVRGRAVRHGLPWPQAATFRVLLDVMRERELISADDFGWLVEIVAVTESADRGRTPRLPLGDCETHLERARRFTSTSTRPSGG